VMELFAMAASVSHAWRLRELGRPEAERSEEIADLFCRVSRRKVRRLFRELWSNDDSPKRRLTADLMNGEHAWLAKGALDPGSSAGAPEARLAPPV